MRYARRFLIIVWLMLPVNAAFVGTGAAQKNEILALHAKVTELARAAKYAEALPFAERELAIAEKAFGPNHTAVAASLNDVARLYFQLGRFTEAEPYYRRTLLILEKVLDPGHREVAGALNNLANLYQNQGRFGDAEPLYRRALEIKEKTIGPDHPDVARSMHNLAMLYRSLGRYSDAEPLFTRSLAIRERTLGPDHREVAVSLITLADLRGNQGRYAEAEPLYKRALKIGQKVLGPNHPDVAAALNNLASLYQAQGRFADAEPLYVRSLTARETTFGPDHIDVAGSLHNLAVLYHNQGRDAEAEPLYKRALAIEERALGPDHPTVAISLDNLAKFFLDQGRYAEALPLTQRVIAIGLTSPAVALPVLYGAQNKDLISAERAMDGGLEVVQRANQSSAAAAVAKLAVRLAAGDDRLAQLVRKDQDLAAEAEKLDKAIVAAVSKEPSKRDAAAERWAKERLAAIAAERAALKRTLAIEFPEYAALSNPLPVTTTMLQSLLSDDEALVAFVAAGDRTTYVFALTRDRFDWKPIPLGAETLSQKVAAFRQGLDVDQISKPDSSRFDLGLAYELHVSLLGPVEALVRDKKQLLVVPSGALTALPFHLLVTEKPAAAIPETFAGYRDAAWLIKRQAVAILPSIASFKALRAFGLRNQGKKPMVGFGDPIFNPNPTAPPTSSRPATKSAARSLNSRAYTEYWRGAEIDRSRLAQSLPQLPDTADELKAIAEQVGAPASDIHLGRDANEATVKRTPLSDFRIVYFATHALVAGDVKGLAEPSIVLSLPPRPSEFDDGLLTSSEIAQLKLNADWVVLSACNTIAGDKPGAEALSGLARSFFYAGARALLVSHWAVDSAAATRLTTSTFGILKSDPKLGRAAALRRAMLDYLGDQSSPQNAYPAFWGPFALIGEGAAR